jgi:hypothetical protein
MMGATAEATKVRRELLQLEPGFCVSEAVARAPFLRQADIDRFRRGLRLGGLPELSHDPAAILL